MNKGGRPISSGSKTDAEGGVRAYLHANRLRRVAEKLEGNDQQFLLIAADVVLELSRRNMVMGRRIGRMMQRRAMTNRGAAFRRAEAAQEIAELAADGPITVYVGRNPDIVRAIRNGRLPRGAKLIGTYDAGADYRQIVEDIAA